MAYLNAPRSRKGSLRGETRLEERNRKGLDSPLPPIDREAAYLLSYLLEVGPVTSSGMGSSALTFVELQAWQTQAGLDLQPWEVTTLRHLSRVYAAESSRAASPAAQPLWIPEIEVNRKAVDEGLRAIFRGLMAQQRAEAEAKKAAAT